ncbi:hypothetical protein PGN35_023775 [Nodosilinea sp. PGN35]|uniref:hypothetical protein n=1 Tax=Nodosilinea sp. PGN35 TaxID=3020489 RepID=UPI0023B2FAD9|nr:hypothetical protein [Nodosilinea sp. TSF1-S3]MDF0370033.1 hypothetical protein [Nodosilinea sp. TSF1-S3]
MAQLNSQASDFDPGLRALSRQSNYKSRRFYRGALALGLIAGLMGACAETAPQRETSDGSTNVQTEEVADNTESYIGQVVTIRSEPIEKVSDTSFTVSDQRLLSNEPILVINASGTPLLLPEDGGIEVQVTGEVRNFVSAELAQELNLIFDPATYEDYEDQPVIIAQSVTLAPEPGEISANPERYYGETLAVTGEVNDVRNETTFTIEENRLLGANDLLIVYATPRTGAQPQPTAAQLPTLTEDEQVAVVGVLRPFVVSELERDYDLTWDAEVQRQLEADYSDRPILVATEIAPSAIPD